MKEPDPPAAPRRSPDLDPLAIARRHFAGAEAYLVGGRVRDWLLGRATADTDIAVPAGAVARARDLAAASGGTCVVLDAERDVARVLWPARGVPSASLDVARFAAPDIAGDLAARDFTVNALGVPLADSAMLDLDAPRGAVGGPAVLDPLGGRADLDGGHVRMTSVAALEADPLRLLRGARLAAELGFDIEPDTARAIRSRAPLVRQAAGERVRDEVVRLIAADDAAAQVRRLGALDLLAFVLPEVDALRGVPQPPPHDRDVFEHSLAVLGAMERLQRRVADASAAALDGLAVAWRLSDVAAWDAVVDARRAALAARLADMEDPAPPARAVWLRLAALLHDVGKPATLWYDAAVDRIRFPQHDHVGAEMVGRTARRLRLSHAVAAYLATIVRHHLRPLYLALDPALSPRLLHRYFRATGGHGIDVVLMSLADNAAKTAGRPESAAVLAGVAARLLDTWFDAFDTVVAPPPLVSGHVLMAHLGLPAGPEVGRLLAALREAQVDGELADVGAALALARRLHAAE